MRRNEDVKYHGIGRDKRSAVRWRPSTEAPKNHQVSKASSDVQRSECVRPRKGAHRNPPTK